MHGPCPMPEGLWAAAAGRLGAAPAAGSGKGGQKCQRRVVPLAVNSAGHWGSTHGESGASGGKQSLWRRAGAFAQFLVYWQQNTCGRGHRAKLRPAPAHRAGPGAALGAGGAAAGLLAAMHWRRGGAHTAKGGEGTVKHSAQKGRAFARGLLLLVLAALALRLVPAALYYNAYDLESYNIPWAITAHENWLAMYEATLGLYPLDYPPLLPTLFGLFGGAMQLSQEVGGTIAANGMLAMVLIKLWPILFDVGTAALLYEVGHRQGMRRPGLAGWLWAVNPAAIYNCALWGQTDCVLLFFVLAVFWALHCKNGLAASLCFALGCLSKLQMAYFAPFLLLGLALCCAGSALRRLGALAAGAALGLAGWLPFMVGGGEGLALPLRIYLGGAGRYDEVMSNAANLYAFGSALNHAPTGTLMRGTVPFATVNAVFWAGIALGLAVYAVWLWRARAAAPALCEAALLYYFTVFFFTQRMRERYLLPALVLAALCALCTRRRGYALLACGLAATTLFNQFLVLHYVHGAPLSFRQALGQNLRLGAVANLALWCAAAALVLWPAVRRTWQAARVRRTAGG